MPELESCPLDRARSLRTYIQGAHGMAHQMRSHRPCACAELAILRAGLHGLLCAAESLVIDLERCAEEGK